MGFSIGDVFKNIPVVGQVVNLAQAIQSGDWKQLLSSVSSLALTFATGGAGAMFGSLTSMVAQVGPQMLSKAITGHIMSSLGQAAIQQFGEKMGLPQTAIDAAQAAFCEACGDKAGARQNFKEAGHLGSGGLMDRLTVSGSERRESKQFLEAILAGSGNPSPMDSARAGSQAESTVDRVMDLFNQELEEGWKKNGGGSSRGAKGGSILMQIAMALGGNLDKKMTEMANTAEELGSLGKVDGKNQSRYGELSGRMSGLGQEVKILQEALNNTLKTIGDASSGLARKQ